MAVITVSISDELNETLAILAQETTRPKGYFVRQALENYLEERADLVLALSRIEKGEATISLEDLEKKYELLAD